MLSTSRRLRNAGAANRSVSIVYDFFDSARGSIWGVRNEGRERSRLQVFSVGQQAKYCSSTISRLVPPLLPQRATSRQETSLPTKPVFRNSGAKYAASPSDTLHSRLVRPPLRTQASRHWPTRPHVLLHQFLKDRAESQTPVLHCPPNVQEFARPGARSQSICPLASNARR